MQPTSTPRMRSTDCLNIEAGPMSQTRGSLERVLHRQSQRIKNLIERRLARATGMAWSTRPLSEYGLVTLASNGYEAELHEFLGPSDPNYSPSDARLPQWRGSLSS